MKFNLICASHDEEILKKNLATSNFFNPCKVLTGFTNVAEAYNSVKSKCAPNEYNIYAHHDLYMPPSFEINLTRAIFQLNFLDPNWGILGVYGATMEEGERKFYGCLKDRGEDIGSSKDLPHEVQTLDELLLITKCDFLFDEQFDLHFYGADICLQSIQQGRKNYVIDSFCHHNSSLKPGYRSESFRECEAKFKNKWRGCLPINTPCALIQ